MRRAIAFLPLPLLFACGGASSGGPRLEVESSFHDFGTLTPGDYGRHAFRAVNRGGAELLVKAVRPSCGCVLPEVVALGPAGKERRGVLDRAGEVLRVGPGETLEVRVLLDPRLATPGVPEALYSVLLETNEPGRPYLRFEFHVRIDVPFNVLPVQVDVDVLGKEETLVREILVVPTLGHAVQILPPTYLPPGVKVAMDREERSLPSGAPQVVYRLAVTLGPGLPVGAFSASILLSTDYREGHRLEIPVHARVVRNVFIHPPAFDLGIVRRTAEPPPASRPGRAVALRLTAPARALRVLGTKIEGEEADHLRTSVREVEAGRHFEVLLETLDGISSASFRGDVLVRTDDPEDSEVRIPYRGYARD
jgi:hypothetical protein